MRRPTERKPPWCAPRPGAGRPWGVITASASSLLVFCLELGPGVAWGQAEAPVAALRPDWLTEDFLQRQPNVKTKRRVRLSGVNTAQHHAQVVEAIDDIVGLLVLFGMTGSELNDKLAQSWDPQRVEVIRQAQRPKAAFARMSTERGLQQPPVEVASNHLSEHIGDWSFPAPDRLEVSVTFVQHFNRSGYVKDPPRLPRRLVFVRQGGRWYYDGLAPPG